MSNNSNKSQWIKSSSSSTIKKDSSTQNQAVEHVQQQQQAQQNGSWKSSFKPSPKDQSSGNAFDMTSILSAPPPPTLRVYDPHQQFNQVNYTQASNINNNNSLDLNSSSTSLSSSSLSLNKSSQLSSNSNLPTDQVDKELLNKILNEEDDDDVLLDETMDINTILQEQDNDSDEDLLMTVDEKIIPPSPETLSILNNNHHSFENNLISSPNQPHISNNNNNDEENNNNNNNNNQINNIKNENVDENILPMLWRHKNSRKSFNGIVIEPQYYTKISEQLQSPEIRKEAGYPTCFSTSKYICIGTSHGYLLIFNYNQELKSIIGGAICADSGSITAIDQPSGKVNEDWMLSGHQNGQIILWDVPTGKPLKVIDKIHKHPMLHLKFFADGNRFISSDAHGVTNIFTVSRGFVSFGVDQQLLLNGNLGPVLSISLLLPGNFPHPTDKSYIFALATKRKILVISASLEGVCILNNKITKPQYVKATGVLPYLSWRRVNFQKNLGHTKPLEPILAIGWGSNIQLLQIVLHQNDQRMQNPEFIVVAEYQSNNDICGLEWLDSQTILLLNSKDELRVFDPFALEEVESVNIKSMQLIHHSKFQDVYSFHNSIRTHKSRIYLLGLNGLFSAHLLTWLERLSILASNQQWFDALCLALDFYEGKAKATTGLSTNTVDSKLLTSEKIIDILSQLCQSIFQQQQQQQQQQVNSTSSTSSSPMKPLITRLIPPQSIPEDNQIAYMTLYQQLALICIEFCVIIKRTDFLFGELFNHFLENGQHTTFLEFLEPYILTDRLVHLNPEVMQYMMNHYQEKGILQRAEQCLLHLDIASLDFHQTIVLCRKHHLYSAIIYLYNKGLDDFITPLEDMMELLIIKPPSQQQTQPKDLTVEMKAQVKQLLLKYLGYCLQGKSYPSGQPIPSTRLPSLKTQIYEYLFLRNIYMEDPTPYPRLYNLLIMDSNEMMKILSNIFFKDPILSQQNQEKSNNNQNNQNSNQNNVIPPLIIPAIPFNINKANFNYNTIMSVLLLIMIDRSQQPMDPHNNQKSWAFSIVQQGQLCILLAKCIENSCIKQLEPTLLNRVIGLLLSPIEKEVKKDFNNPNNQNNNNLNDNEYSYNQENRQSSLLIILRSTSPKDYDMEKLLVVAEGNELYRVAQYIYGIQRQYAKMVVCQIRDPATRSNTFEFVRTLLTSTALNEADYATVKQTTISNLAQLIVVDSQATAQLIMDYFAADHEKIVKELNQFPKLQYTYLVGLLGGEQSNRTTILQKTGINLSNDTYELYIKLMCMFSPESVFKYLVTHDDYPLDACLKICQQYNNFEASTYLLERTGDVQKALEMILIILKRKIEDILKHFSNIFANVKNIKNDKVGPLEKEIFDVLNSAISLCQRNSPKLQSNDNQIIWFKLLDSIVVFVRKVKQSLLNNNGVLVLDDNNWSKGSVQSSSLNNQSIQQQPQEVSTSNIKKNSVYIKCTGFLHKLVHLILNNMMGYVALPQILSKIVNDHGSDEFGEYKTIISGMLDTCTYETSILNTANHLIQNDMYNATLSYINKRSIAYSPNSTKCIMCSRPLGEFPTQSSIQQSQLDLIVVFQCGHSLHSTCLGKHQHCPLCSSDHDNKSTKKDKSSSSSSNSNDQQQQLVFDPKKIRQDKSSTKDGQNSIYLQRLSNFTDIQKRLSFSSIGSFGYIGNSTTTTDNQQQQQQQQSNSNQQQTQRKRSTRIN